MDKLWCPNNRILQSSEKELTNNIFDYERISRFILNELIHTQESMYDCSNLIFRYLYWEKVDGLFLGTRRWGQGEENYYRKT